jgi:putative mRNA 3-end processing factor
MFHYDRGLKITRIDLAIDICRRQPRGFISHAHTDHMARHELAICTPATSQLYQFRFGPRPTQLLPFGESHDWDSVRISAHPAGHVFGSAMLLVEHDGERLLYTGDFKLSDSATAERASPPPAEVLIMESTFGDPRYRLPPREAVVAQLVEIVARALESGQTPVIHAYVLGKAQEVTKILCDHGIPVVQHPLVFAVSQIYEKSGCRLGDYQACGESPPVGCAVIVPPRSQKAARIRNLVRPVTIAVTGWAADPLWRRRLGVDYAVPLSDHADYDELLECIERVAPRVIYCTHGPAEFVARLRKLGHDAHPLSACTAGPVKSAGVQALLFS